MVRVSGKTVVTAVTLAIGGNGSKMAYLLHSAGTAHGVPTECIKSQQAGAGEGQHPIRTSKNAMWKLQIKTMLIMYTRSNPRQAL